MKEKVTLIFDVGKTVKKAVIFDEGFAVIEERTQSFAEKSDDDGFLCDDLQGIVAWIRDTISSVFANRKYEVTHINFSAYGASLVNIDGEGNTATPFYNYLKPFPDDLKRAFLDQYDDGHIFQTTASPFFGFLNSGLQLFWLARKKPALLKKVNASLHLPQYLAFSVTGEIFSEITSIGCHTLLWDFDLMTYHKWVTKENLVHLLPRIVPSNHRISAPISDRTIISGVGVHDSSAALMPYLHSFPEKFILLSTGTWNIAFNPFSNASVSADELSRDCLCYLTHEGKPVKAARIFLGHEHDAQVQLLASHFKTTTEALLKTRFNEALCSRLMTEDNPAKIVHPAAMEGSGPVPMSGKATDFGAFADATEAYHQVVQYLAIWQKQSLDLVDPLTQVKTVIVVGGFSKNNIFMEMLRRLIPDRTFMISDHPRAAALGAAWLVNPPRESVEGILSVTKF